MKKNLITLALGLSSIAVLAFTSGCVVEGPYPPGPAVVAVVPDDYVWDGYEYVGWVGDRYYYLGPSHVWITCDPVRVQRFNAYVGVHPDWRGHATVNVQYRRDARGHEHPGQVKVHRQEDRDDHGHGHEH